MTVSVLTLLVTAMNSGSHGFCVVSRSQTAILVMCRLRPPARDQNGGLAM